MFVVDDDVCILDIHKIYIFLNCDLCCLFGGGAVDFCLVGWLVFVLLLWLLVLMFAFQTNTIK